MLLYFFFALAGLLIGTALPQIINHFSQRLEIEKLNNNLSCKIICAAVTAITYILVVNKFGITHQAYAALFFTTVLIALSLVDFAQCLLPDLITIPMIIIGLLLNYFAMFTSMQEALIGAVAGYTSLYAVYIIYKSIRKKEGIGFGDFKLFSLLGAWLGASVLLPCLMIAAFCGSIIGIALIVFTKHGREMPIAFGPYLALAGFIMLLYKDNIFEFYIYLFSF